MEIKPLISFFILQKKQISYKKKGIILIKYKFVQNLLKKQLTNKIILV